METIKYICEFVSQDAWHFWGTIVFVSVVAGAIADVIHG